MKKHCIDCKKEIKLEHKRCWKCYCSWIKIPEHNVMFGRKLLEDSNGNYKGGRKCFCIDCNKLLSRNAYYRKNKRCKSCCQKGDLNSFRGKYHTKRVCRKLSISHGGTGISYEFRLYNQAKFNKFLKEIIRKRDKYKCQICEKLEKDHIRANKFIHLIIHHIDYNKLNNNESNLCTLCHSCNIAANFNRDYWYAYFKYIIEHK